MPRSMRWLARSVPRREKILIALGVIVAKALTFWGLYLLLR
jgi:hypothetical protein